MLLFTKSVKRNQKKLPQFRNIIYPQCNNSAGSRKEYNAIFLFQLLESCANPSGSKTNIRIEASSEIRTELYKALREVMDIARQGRSQVKSWGFQFRYHQACQFLGLGAV